MTQSIIALIDRTYNLMLVSNIALGLVITSITLILIFTIWLFKYNIAKLIFKNNFISKKRKCMGDSTELQNVFIHYTDMVKLVDKILLKDFEKEVCITFINDLESLLMECISKFISYIPELTTDKETKNNAIMSYKTFIESFQSEMIRKFKEKLIIDRFYEKENQDFNEYVNSEIKFFKEYSELYCEQYNAFHNREDYIIRVFNEFKTQFERIVYRGFSSAYNRSKELFKQIENEIGETLNITSNVMGKNWLEEYNLVDKIKSRG